MLLRIKSGDPIQTLTIQKYYGTLSAAFVNRDLVLCCLGFGICPSGNIVLCQYHDMSLVLTERHAGNVLWRSREHEMGGFMKALSAMVSTDQPADCIAITMQGMYGGGALLYGCNEMSRLISGKSIIGLID